MSSHVSRRKFALAASSLGAAMMTGPLNFLAKMGGGSSRVFPSAGAVSQSQAGGQTKLKALVFDVNQTMLDLNVLRPHFVRVFGDGKALDEWFSLLLHYSLVVTVADADDDFRTVGKGARAIVARP